MSDSISGISGINSLDPIKRIEQITRQQSQKIQEKDADAPDFQKILNDAIKNVNTQITSANQAADDFAAGKISNIHDVIIMAEKASMSLTLTMEVRNKIVDAYKEIMRMQL
ncbi:MAG TPA: flagellar hook-basal body complex protein FliE [Thermotogota bacterium]|nr:flagellar hook-basal body complex protein FliE [Thermotogota bacterium]HPJ89182.1 flagellar hook-basal body complex protein FliE [Thermotogota bacterium]HPR95655.1 flagellar hook-basal body complex protein FliE [Thermotogota bacterium]